MGVMSFRAGACAAALCLCASLVWPQVIEFETNGLRYQTLTRGGVTVMYAHLPNHVRDFTILQVAVANGSKSPFVIRPEDFSIARPEGGEIHAWHASDVVALLLAKGNRSDVIKLVSAYEEATYGISRMKSTNGYEARRRAALAEVSSTKLKAASAASAIALVQTKLAPGESTDGAVFFQDDRKAQGEYKAPGSRLIVRTNTETFVFNPEKEPAP
jgi:hypothetical protein